MADTNSKWIDELRAGAALASAIHDPLRAGGVKSRTPMATREESKRMVSIDFCVEGKRYVAYIEQVDY